MRIGMETVGAKEAGRSRDYGVRNRQPQDRDYAEVQNGMSAKLIAGDGTGSRLWQMESAGREAQGEENSREGEEAGAGRKVRSEAEKIYQAAVSGKKNPIQELRHKPKVPYEHLAKDGVIEYNGVCFVCDEKTNSICLGDMSDKKNVLTIALSGGGHLKVNRDNLGQLSKAVGMFSPEDMNLIMRAIAQDTKIQSVKRR